MQEHIADARVPEVLMVADQVFAALEPVRLGQGVQDRLGIGNLYRHALFGAIDSPHELLHVIDARAAVLAVEHDHHRAMLFQNGRQRRQARRRVLQMMQDPGAIDVVELP